VTVHAQAADAARGASTIVLAVKPQVMKAVCGEIADAVATTRPLVVSIAAGIRLEQFARWLGANVPVVRAMPNTPALIGAGASGLVANAVVTPEQRERAANLLGAAGIAAWIDREDLMDTVTALSGSGPAYFFLLVEALVDAAVAQGLPRDVARALAAQTCLGAGRMLVEDGEAPATLRERHLARRHDGRRARRIRRGRFARARRQGRRRSDETRWRTVRAVRLSSGVIVAVAAPTYNRHFVPFERHRHAMGYFAQAAQILLDCLFGIAIFLLVLRVLLQVARANFYNPVCQFLYKTTNPVLMPLRKLIPGWRNIDIGRCCSRGCSARSSSRSSMRCSASGSACSGSR
jgi:uncharacterized protein YggT (Ycf19 family)